MMILMDGFRYGSMIQGPTQVYGQTVWDSANAAYIEDDEIRVGASNVRFPLGANAAQKFLGKVLDIGQDTYVVGLLAQYDSVASNDTAGTILFQRGNITQIMVRREGADVVVHNGLIELGRKVGVVAASTPVYIEFKVVFDVTNGSVDLRINGDEPGKLSLTGVSTANATAIDKYPDTFAVRGDLTTITRLTDIYLLDGQPGLSEMLGVHVVETFFPTADGVHSGFVPDNGGSQFEEVDEQEDSKLTWTASSAANIVSVVGGGPTTAIYAIQTLAGALKTGDVSRTAQHNLRIAGTDYKGQEKDLSHNPRGGVTAQVWEKNPATGADWHPDHLSALDMGFDLL